MYNIVSLIKKKRDGGEFSEKEIRWIITEYTADRIPNYQMAALAMAIYFQSMTATEVGIWTDAMLNSGKVLDLSDLGSGRVDKHSTGGVGDKISIPLAPAAAAAGVIVPMVAGRGLGHTGGTVDKFEAIPGYNTSPSPELFHAILKEVGCCVIGQTEDIAPADKRLYALRDVTATVESIPLITSSIMSKKLAEGIEGLVLDIKVGPSAFMKTVEQARELAESMVRVGNSVNKKVVVFLTRMDAPLGRTIGNSVEIEESIDCLAGQGPADIRELVVTLGGAMVELAKGVSFAEGKKRIEAVLDNGSGLAAFETMVTRLGGDLKALPKAKGKTELRAEKSGYISEINGLECGLVGVHLGAGRFKTSDIVNPTVGIIINKQVNEPVEMGDVYATIVHDEDYVVDRDVLARLKAAFRFAAQPSEQLPLIIERIG